MRPQPFGHSSFVILDLEFGISLELGVWFLVFCLFVNRKSEMNDLKFAFRQLLKNPGFNAVAVLTLALGIAANTAVFSFVNAILLQPLPYKDADRLVIIYENYPANGWFKNAVAAPMLDVWRKQSTVFEGLGARGYS